MAGLSAADAAADRPSAGVLTFLIADIRGYTAFTRAHGDEAAARLASAFAEIAREGVEARGGSVIELRGDEALATFTSPRAALRAAVELQLVFADEAARDADLPLRVGIGLDLGEAVPVEDGYRGAALNIAARLCAVAGPGDILATAAVTDLARGAEGLRLEPHEPLSLKGIDEPVRVSTVVPVATGVAEQGVVRPRPSVAADVPVELDPVVTLSGRDTEARALRWAWRQARTGSGRSLVIAGPAGSGKTRLAAEPAVLAAHDGAAVTYASARGPGASLRPAIAQVRDPLAAALVIVDDLEAATTADLAALTAALDGIEQRPVLLLVLVDDQPSDDLARGVQRLSGTSGPMSLRPLRQPAVEAIVASYASDPADPPPVHAIEQASGGLPARIHALASDWAHGVVTRRLASSASRAAAGRRDLRLLEAEVASDVVDLQLAAERSSLMGRTTAAATGRVEASPFKGLVAFDVADADVFFGRERLVAELVGRLAGSSFLAVVGPSGSGKSSAVRAGLLPALGDDALPGAAAWTTVLLRPGPRPMRELDRLLYGSLPEEARGVLSAAPDPLAAAASALPPEARPLVVVDQFEELFTTTADTAERGRFVDVLVRAAQTGLASVIIAIRADFYGSCAEYPELADLLSTNHVLVGPMTAEEYRRAIEGPARRAGLQVDPALVDALVVEVVDEPGGLPLLSTALLELWQRRDGRHIRLSAYAATGGVRGAVARLAESAYGELDTDGQQVARSLFLRLAAGSGEAAVRRRVPLDELDATTNPTVGEVVRAMTNARLLTVSEGSVEVAHEALLREWPRLQGWLEEDRAGRRLREHLMGSAREWQSSGRDTAELYRGTRLAAAMDWTTDHTLELNETERAFLAESRRASEQDTQRQRRTNRRLKALLGVAVVALVLAVGAGALAAMGRSDAQHAATAADAQRLGAVALTEKDIDLSLLLARQGVSLDDSPAARANLLSALNRSPAVIGAWKPVSGRPLDISVSPDGRSLLVDTNKPDTYLIDAATGNVIRDLGTYATFAADGSVLVWSNDGTTLSVTSVASPTVTRTIAIPAGVNSLSPAPDLSTLAVVDPDLRGVSVLDTATDSVLRHLTLPEATILDVEAYAGGSLMTVDHAGLVDASDEEGLRSAYHSPVTLHWWTADASQPAWSIPATDGGAVQSVDVAAGLLALDEGNDVVGLYDLATGARRDTQIRHDGLQGSSFSPDGKTLVTAGDDGLLQVVDVASGAVRETLAGHAGRVFSPALSDADGHLTAWSVGLDAQLIEWDIAGDRRLGRSFESGGSSTYGSRPTAQGLAVSPDGRLLAITGPDGQVTIIDTASLGHVKDLAAVPGGQALGVAFSPDGRTLAVAGTGAGTLQRWDAATWTPLGNPLSGLPATLPSDPEAAHDAPPSELPNAATAVAFSPDGRLIAAGAEDGAIYLWDASTGALVGQPIRAGGPVYAVAFSPASDALAATYVDFSVPDTTSGMAGVWRVADRHLLYRVSVDDGYGTPFAVTFSPDGKLLATGGGIGAVRFWDATSGAANGRSIIGEPGWVESLSFDPTGATIVSAGTDATAHILDVTGRRQLGTSLPIVGAQDSRATWSPDGTRLYIVDATGPGYEWDVGPGALDAQACAITGRTLTKDEWASYLPGRPYQPACTGN